ncbi:glycosyltransferase family 4 protein [Amnibacterium endophyticum]|uniref:Glycosyltransferase family 4 protein n=1 Tax=Amnibacterium endophyticum TaxID=2109337 RepID=A0ABW4LA62_9MICO
MDERRATGDMAAAGELWRSAAGERRDPRQRVVFLSGAAEPWGAEHSLRAIASRLPEHGMAVEVWCSSESTTAFLRQRPGLRVRRIATAHGRAATVLAFGRALLAERPAVAVVFSLYLLPVVALCRALGTPTRFVLDLHDMPRGRGDLLAVHLLGSLSSGLIAISRSTAQWARRIRAPQRIVPRPMEGPAAPPRDAPRAPFRLGVVGRLDPEKRIELAIAAVAQVPQAVLVVYGSPGVDGGRYAEGLRDLAESTAPGRVLFQGRRPPAEIYPDLDALMVANDREPSGRSVGEAMLAGIPVITPDRGGAVEFHEPDTSGIQFTAGDADGAADALRSLIDDRRRYAAIAVAGQRRLLDERDPAAVAACYAHALRELAG